jgi:SAM-dependent methyltransferase
MTNLEECAIMPKIMECSMQSMFAEARLVRGEHDIWFAGSTAPISYPADGNIMCRQLEEHSFWFRHRNECISSVVSRFHPSGIFLDIGGGNGYVAKGLDQAGIDCALLEPGIDGARAARARGVERVICARLEDLDMVPGRLAAAGMFDVLEHIEDEAGTLRRVHALLRHGGRLFLTVPAYNLLYSSDDTAAGHFRRYSRASLSRSLVRAGFRMEYATYFFSPLPPLIFLLRTLPSWLGMRQGVDEQRQAAEHGTNGIASRLLVQLLRPEAKFIAAGRRMPFGASCLAVAVRI